MEIDVMERKNVWSSYDEATLKSLESFSKA